MSPLALERCLNHPSREAACRCPSCGNFFCRECVVLFESRLLCAACLAAQCAAPALLVRRRSPAAASALALAGLLLAWWLFYLAGWALIQWSEHTPAAALSPALAPPRSSTRS
ncbi:MAG: hypothetical protein JO340_19035 [Acidobacteriaceae bacterium]|nr:hypothetical protein [Acidobacteriaceae bacterium]